jgi:poly-gamma-glutamate synthesis protein (capsule biosynthesis protein)
MTIFAYTRADGEGVHDIGFVPCRLRPDGRIEPVQRDSTEGQEVIAYVERCNVSQGLNARLTTDDAIDLAGWSTVRVVPR